MVRLYADENFPLPVVESLRDFGHDVLTIAEAGQANQRYPDTAVLQDATKRGRAVLTLNRKHFARLHEQMPVHSGIILCTYDPDFVGQAQRIDQQISVLDSLNEQMIRVNRPAS